MRWTLLMLGFRDMRNALSPIFIHHWRIHSPIWSRIATFVNWWMTRVLIGLLWRCRNSSYLISRKNILRVDRFLLYSNIVIYVLKLYVVIIRQNICSIKLRLCAVISLRVKNVIRGWTGCTLINRNILVRHWLIVTSKALFHP